jgi:hypothetical protein
MARNFLSGDALTVYKSSATEYGNNTNASFILTLQSLTTHIFALRTLSFRKRYMRRHIHKPQEMTTRAFAAQVAKLIAY